MQITNPFRKLFDDPCCRNPWSNGAPAQPLYLDLELTNKCNYSCSFCVRGQMNRPLGDMDWDMYLNLIDTAASIGIKGIRYNRWGEPMLYPKFIEAIEYAKSRGLLTHVTTNGSKLTEEMCVDLVCSGLDSIIISFQGVNEHTYNRLRQKNKYYHTVEGVKNLLKAKNEFVNPFVAVSTTVTKQESEEDIGIWERAWETCGVDSVIINATWFKRLKSDNTTKIYDIIDDMLPMLERFQCQEVYPSLAVDWDGTLSPCCLDYDQQLAVGKFPDDDLLEVWRGEEIKSIRNLLDRKRQDLLLLCSTCQLNSNFRGQ